MSPFTESNSNLGTPQSARPPNKPGRALAILSTGLCALVLVAGVVGLDRWFYEHVALELDTPDPQDTDFYHRTQVVWDLIRFFPHYLGASLACLAILVARPTGVRRAAVAAAAIIVVALTANLAQEAIGRLRPNRADSAWSFTPIRQRFDKRRPAGFPSGEVATGFAIAGALAQEFRRGKWGFYSLAMLVVVARVSFGMHYLSDVMAGALLGGWLEFAVSQFMRRRIGGICDAPEQVISTESAN